MEPLFENNYTRDKNLAKEMYQHIFFKRPLNMVLNGLLLLVFVVNLSIAIGTNDWSNGLYLIIIPVFFGYEVFTYYRAVNTMVKRDLEVNQGQKIEIVVTVSEEGLQQKASTGGESQLAYADIKKTMQTKNLILLQSEANLLYILRKDTFTKGNAKEFVAFLQGKGVKIK